MKIKTYAQRMDFIEMIDITSILSRNNQLVKYMRSPKGKQHLIESFKRDKTTRIANQITKRDPILVMRAYFIGDSFCELMLPYSINKDLLPNADPYFNPTAEAFRQFRIEAKL